MVLNKDALLNAYRTMQLIRTLEERLHEIAEADNPFGFAHLYAGAEAAAVGIAMHLEPSMRDVLTSTHRAHGHLLAKGGDLKALAKELWGKAGGSGGGKGGTMHVADWSVGMHGANGIIGASAPHALGFAFAAKSRNTGGVAVTVCGDGASNQGAIFESMNLAKVLALPVIFVQEDNGYAESTGKGYSVSGTPLARAAGFDIPGIELEGSDFFAIYEAAGKVISRAREGHGPSMLHIHTPLFFGHFEGESDTYRGNNEVALLRAERDCLAKFRRRVEIERSADLADLDRIKSEVDAEVDEAIREAEDAPYPAIDELTTNVYASY